MGWVQPTIAAMALMLAACATEQEGAQPVLPIPTSIQLAFSGDTAPVLGVEEKSQIELLRKGAEEPILLDFQNGVFAVGKLPPGEYSIARIGPLYCRGVTFDIDQSSEARALGSLRAEIITTDYYVALMSRHTATDAELSRFADLVGATPGSIDARPVSITERAPCFAGTGGPGTTWQGRPLEEKILLGLFLLGLCAGAVAAGGFCAF